jgi:hypothetical protein
MQDAPPQLDGWRAGRRYLRWAPLGIAGVSFAAAVAATLIASVPSATDQLTVDQLVAGDCLTGSNLGLGTNSRWPDTVAALPCTQPHIAEVFFAGNVWPQSAAYPGNNAISEQAQARCDSAFQAYDGIVSTACRAGVSIQLPSTSSALSDGIADARLDLAAPASHSF